MSRSGPDTFLQQAHRNNWQQYLASLQLGAAPGWDLCILTASDERQAAMYREQLNWRRAAGLLPARTQFSVLADPPKCRIGSGGATIRGLAQALPQAPTPPQGAHVAGPRILMIHSGGDSKRLPHCSAAGKLFARIPRPLPDGRASTVFDEFLIGLSGLAAEAPAGVLLASGDVLLVFDHLQLSFRRGGVIGVAAATPAEMGTRHGVYVPGEGGHHVRAYLHKPPLAGLAAWDAIAQDGTVLIDTGLVWWDLRAAATLAGLVDEPAVRLLLEPPAEPGLHDGSMPGLNLYGDLLLPLAASTTFEDYLADTSDGPAVPAVQEARRLLWRELRGLPFTVDRLQPAVFEHFGTSREYWEMVAGDSVVAQLCGWTAQAAAWLGPTSPGAAEGLVLANALVRQPIGPPEGRAASPVLVADSHLGGPFAWLGRAIVSGVCTDSAFQAPADSVLHQMAVAGGWVTLCVGLFDDPKQAWSGASASFMNRPWAEWLAEAGLAADRLWPGMAESERALWNAQLYAVAEGRDVTLRLALALADPAGAAAGWQAAWAAAPRLSLGQAAAQADGGRLLAGLAEIEDQVAAQHFLDAVAAEKPAGEIRALLGPAGNLALARRAACVAGRLAGGEPLLAMRGHKALHAATGDAGWEDRAFATLARMIQDAAARPSASTARPAHRLSGGTRQARPASVRAAAAARIDFGGGWTDTPPHSIERGGMVLNAALTLAGGYPVAVEAAWLSEPRLILESRDLDAVLVPGLAGEVLAYVDPADPFALPKAALVLRGIVPAGSDPAAPLADVLRPLGGGLRLCTGTSIPRGSGLGTSSIMAGAVLAALDALLGREACRGTEPAVAGAGDALPVRLEALFADVLCLEQMLTTGGGWQDQVGGLLGGLKLVTTGPGLPQQIQVKPLRLAPAAQAELAGRLALVYTGQQRLAKNLLRHVMGRWMARDPEMVWVQGQIGQMAQAMRYALEAGDVDCFGALVSEHWALNRRMDPGCSNPFIDELFEVMAPYINGAKLAGAGGGGFAIVIARGPEALADLKRALAELYPGTRVGVWPCAIPAEGLMVECSDSLGDQ